MENTIQFKPYTNTENIKYFEIPKFIYTESSYNHIYFKAKVIYTIIYNDFNNDFIEKHTDKDGNVYIEVKQKSLIKDSGYSRNTVNDMKQCLIENGLIKEVTFKGRKANRIYLNTDLELSNSNSTYTDKEGQNKLNYYQMPKFLLHDYFKKLTWESIFIYSVIRSRMNVSIINSRTSRKFVNKYGDVFCIYSNQELSHIIDAKTEGTVKRHKDLLLALGLLKVNTQSTASNKTYLEFYVKEPVALPVNNQDQSNTNKTHKRTIVFKAKNDIYTTMKLFYKAKVSDFNQDVSKIKEEGVKNNEERCQKSGSSYPYSSKPSISNQSSDSVCDSEDTKLDSNNKSNTETQQESPSISNYENNDDLYYSKELESYKKRKKLKNYPELLSRSLMIYSAKDIGIISGALCDAKDEYNSDQSTDYTIESVEYELVDTLRKIRNANTKKPAKETVEARFNYIKAAFKDVYKKHNIANKHAELEKIFNREHTVNSLDFKRFNEKMFKQAKQSNYTSTSKINVPATNDELDALGVY